MEECIFFYFCLLIYFVCCYGDKFIVLVDYSFEFWVFWFFKFSNREEGEKKSLEIFLRGLIYGNLCFVVMFLVEIFLEF